MLSSSILGVTVYTSDNVPVGTVSEVQQTRFKVDGRTTAFWLPENIVRSRSGTAELNVPAHHLSDYKQTEPTAT